MDIKEKLYTSTVEKIAYHKSIVERIKQGIARPISLQLAPTDKCNLNCVFCSVKDRAGDELPLDVIKKALDEYKELGAKTLEITGGGDPTMYPHINELIEYAHEKGFELGMITNGVILKHKIKQENLDKFTRIRVSLSGLDYNCKYDLPTIKGTLGFSYVRNEKSSDEKLQQINDMAEKYGASFVRVVPNCLNVEEKEKYIEELRPKIAKYPKLFFQEKEHKVPRSCMIGYYKPFIAPDGYVYHCSANPLIDRKFNHNFTMGRIENIKEIYENPKVFDTSLCQEGKCFFKEQNDYIMKLKNGEEVQSPTVEIQHKNFI